MIRFHPISSDLIQCHPIRCSDPIVRCRPGPLQNERTRLAHALEQTLHLSLAQAAQLHCVRTLDAPVPAHVTQHHLLVLNGDKACLTRVGSLIRHRPGMRWSGCKPVGLSPSALTRHTTALTNSVSGRRLRSLLNSTVSVSENGMACSIFSQHQKGILPKFFFSKAWILGRPPDKSNLRPAR